MNQDDAVAANAKQDVSQLPFSFTRSRSKQLGGATLSFVRGTLVVVTSLHGQCLILNPDIVELANTLNDIVCTCGTAITIIGFHFHTRKWDEHIVNAFSTAIIIHRHTPSVPKPANKQGKGRRSTAPKRLVFPANQLVVLSIARTQHQVTMAMNFIGCRTCFEVRVGSHHSAEMVLHLRRKDVRRMRQREILTEIINLLKLSVIPRMFHEEIEASQAALTKKKLPPELGPGGVPVEVGEKNRQQNQQRKRKSANPSKSAANQQVSEPSQKEKAMYHAFGKGVKLAYRLQESKSSASATLVVNGDGQYARLTKLSKRILIWGYPLDPDHITEEDVPASGQQEMIPISCLFRQSFGDSQSPAVGPLLRNA